MSRRSECRIQISSGFFLLAAWFGVVNGWRLLAVVLGAAAVHEMGHWAVLKCMGAPITGLRLNVFGAVMETDRTSLSYGGELAAVLAGPAANLLCAVLLSLADKEASVLIGANLILCMFNLLPVRPLDGGRALYLLVSYAQRVQCFIKQHHKPHFFAVGQHIFPHHIQPGNQGNSAPQAVLPVQPGTKYHYHKYKQKGQCGAIVPLQVHNHHRYGPVQA